MAQTISGLASGLDSNAIIAQLVAIERRSQKAIQARAGTAQLQLTNYQAIRNLLGAAKTSGQALLRPTDWQPLTATSSNESAVKVTAGSGTVTGSVAFTVDRLASAATYRSSNVVNGTGTTIANDASIFVAAGGGALGFSTISSDDTLALGSHTVTVTQSSAAAAKQGSGPLDASTVIDDSNKSLNVRVNGTLFNLTLATGTYDRSQLATAVNAAATAAGAAFQASVDPASNEMVLTTGREGSAASLQVTGGTALSALQLTTDGSAVTGTDAKVKVDSGAETAIDTIEAGGSATIAADAGSLTVAFAGGLRTGTLSGKNVSTGDRTLATVVANINGASAGVTAAAVQVGAGQYRLQLTATTTGAGNAPNIATTEFTDAVGGMVTLSAGSDAQVTVGSGPGAYTITNTSNTISNLLPGVSVTLAAESATPVTISVSRDSGAIADKVEALIKAVNTVRAGINEATKYDPDTKVASPLTGDSTVRRLVDDISRALTNATSWTTPGSPGLAGVSVDKTGMFSFDRDKFSTAFNANPEALARVFTQGGTASSGLVSFVSANDRAVAGTYDVVVTTPAAQASATGLEGSWPMPSPPTVKVRIGGTEVSYTVGASDSQASVASALNQKFAAAGLALVASERGTGIEVKSQAFGSTAAFDVDWGGGYTTKRGTDVAGTINGVAGQGTGQQLAIAFDHPTLGGLALNVAATTAGSVGTFTYQPGIAQRLTSVIGAATDSVTGYLTSSEKSKQARIKFVNESVDQMEQRLVMHEARLKSQFAALESTIGTYKNMSSYLGSQLASLGGSR